MTTTLRAADAVRHSLVLLGTALCALPALAQLTAPKISFNFNGLLDVGFRNIRADDPTQSRTFLSNSNTNTTLLIGRVTADFGNGLAGIVLAEIDNDPTHSSKQNQAVGSNVFTGSPFQGQQYVGLATPYGTLKLGVPNSWGLAAGGTTASPFGTGQGSGYHAGTPFMRLGTTAVSGVTNYVGGGVGRIVRHERSATFETPTFGGLAVQLEYAPGNDNAADGSANNNNEWQAIGARFQRGAALLMAWHGESKAGANRAAGTTPPSSTTQVANALAAGQRVKWDIVSGNYKVLPDLTLYAGYSRTATSNDVERTHAANVAAKYTIGSIDLLGNYLVRSANKGTAAAAANKVPRAHLLGLGVDYRFDDPGLNALYLRYEDIDKQDALGRAMRILSIGLRVGFNL